MKKDFKKYILLICVIVLSLSTFAQIKVINNKGTFFQIDTSKWSIIGVDIYNKNTNGNVGIGAFPYGARLVVHSSAVPALKLKYPFTGAISDSILTWNPIDSTVRKITLLNLLTGNTIRSLNGLTVSTQTFATGTDGTDFNISSSGSTHTFNIPNASSSSNRGLLTNTDWVTFNNKIGVVTAVTAAAVITTGTTATIQNTEAYWNANQLRGFNISTTGPTTNGQILSWDGTAWTPTTPANGTVTNVTGTLPITVTNGSTTPDISISRNNIVAGSSSVSATNPLVLDGGATNAVVGGVNATLTVNNTAPLWNANQLQGKNISTTAPTNGQVLAWNDTTSQWVPTSSTLTSTNGIDIGYIVAWGSNTTPPDYLLPLTGGTYNWADFPHFQAFQATHPSQFITNNGTTFTLKDINTSGRFLRGGLTANVDQNGSTAMPINPFVLNNYTHNHSYTDINETGNLGTVGSVFWGSTNAITSLSSSSSSYSTSDNTHTHTLSGGDTETRPINTSVIWCIKVKPTMTAGDIIINNNSLTQTVTNLTQNTTSGQISYTNENSTTQTAQVVSSNSNNILAVGTDGGAYYQKKVIDIYNYLSSSQNLTSTAATLVLNTIRTNLSSAFSLSTNQVTVNESGVYRITYSAGLTNSASIGEYTGEFWLERNGNTIKSSNLYINCYNYSIACETRVIIIELTSGDVIRVRMRTDTSNSVQTIPECSSINFEKIN